MDVSCRTQNHFVVNFKFHGTINVCHVIYVIELVCLCPPQEKHYLQEIQQRAGKAKKSKKKKTNTKSKYVDFKTAPSNAIYFLFDVETTGSKRNWDCIIAISLMAYDQTGHLISTFSRKINPGKVRINRFLTSNVHGKWIACITMIIL